MNPFKKSRAVCLISIGTLITLNLFNALNDYGLKTITLNDFYESQLNSEGIKKIEMDTISGHWEVGEPMAETIIKSVSLSYAQFELYQDSVIVNRYHLKAVENNDNMIERNLKVKKGIVYKVTNCIKQYPVGNTGKCFIIDCQ